MRLASERSIFLLNDYTRKNFLGMNGSANKSTFLRRVGLTEAEFDELLSGEKLLDEVRFYKLLECCRDFDYSGQRGQRPEWFIETPNWELVGLVERTITLKKDSGEKISGLQGIVKVPTVILDEPEVYIEEGDVLSRKFSADRDEVLYVESVIDRRQESRKPAYVLTVRRGKPKMKEEKTYNTNFLLGKNNSVAQGDDATVTMNETVQEASESSFSLLEIIADTILRKLGLR